MKQRILITGARSAVALDLAREFHSTGYEVHTADCSSAFISRWSNAVKQFHHYRSPNADPQGFNEDIIALSSALRPLHIIPTCEEVFHLAKPALRPSIGHLLFAPELEQLHELHGKHSFIALCTKIGIPAPESHVLTDQDALQDFSSGEWVFKPCYSRFGEEALIAPSPTQLSRVIPDSLFPWLAQRRIYGQEFSFYAIAQQGKLITIAPYFSNWRLAGGASYAFISAPAQITEKITRIASKIAAATNLTGQFSCDLIMDKQEQLWPIECNPRTTSGLHLLSGNGAVAKAITQATPASVQHSTRYLKPMMLLNGLNPSRFINCKRTLEEGEDVLGVHNDRLPMIGALLDTAVFSCRAIGTGTTLTQATTKDIEWNGEPFND